jgi:hypothetical protein
MNKIVTCKNCLEDNSLENKFCQKCSEELCLDITCSILSNKRFTRFVTSSKDGQVILVEVGILNVIAKFIIVLGVLMLSLSVITSIGTVQAIILSTVGLG